MTRRTGSSPLWTLVALRPTGAALARETHAFATSATLRAAAGDMVRRCRDERGFTPSVRCIRTDRHDGAPWTETDVTAVMLGAGW